MLLREYVNVEQSNNTWKKIEIRRQTVTNKGKSFQFQDVSKEMALTFKFNRLLYVIVVHWGDVIYFTSAFMDLKFRKVKRKIPLLSNTGIVMN